MGIVVDEDDAVGGQVQLAAQFDQIACLGSPVDFGGRDEVEIEGAALGCRGIVLAENYNDYAFSGKLL